MFDSWQTPAALAVVLAAGIYAIRALYREVRAALTPPATKDDTCGGGCCGCASSSSKRQ